jgi:hypothetical protein
LLHELEERRGALLRPIEESERRIATLKQCVMEAARSLKDLGHLLAAEQDRLSRAFAEQRERFLAQAIPAARKELAERLPLLAEGRGPALRTRAMHLARDVAERWLERWRTEEQPAAERMYRQAAERFTELANGFLERVSPSGELPGLPGALGPEVGFRTPSRLYYTQMLTLTGHSPFGWLVDVLRPRGQALRACARDAGKYLGRLLVTNATRLTSDLDDRVLESRRRLEVEIRSHLREVYATAERALERAREKQASGRETVEAEVARLDALHRQVEALRRVPTQEG